jgi:hypothetical protein
MVRLGLNGQQVEEPQAGERPGAEPEPGLGVDAEKVEGLLVIRSREMRHPGTALPPTVTSRLKAVRGKRQKSGAKTAIFLTFIQTSLRDLCSLISGTISLSQIFKGKPGQGNYSSKKIPSFLVISIFF